MDGPWRKEQKLALFECRCDDWRPLAFCLNQSKVPPNPFVSFSYRHPFPLDFHCSICWRTLEAYSHQLGSTFIRVEGNCSLQNSEEKLGLSSDSYFGRKFRRKYLFYKGPCLEHHNCQFDSFDVLCFHCRSLKVIDFFYAEYLDHLNKTWSPDFVMSFFCGEEGLFVPHDFDIHNFRVSAQTDRSDQLDGRKWCEN